MLRSILFDKMSHLLLTQASNESYDQVLGIKRKFDDPYNIFISVRSLVDVENNLVNVYVYRIGKEKILYWFYVEKGTLNVTQVNNCKYDMNQLDDLISTWKKNGYVYTANAVTDRASARLRHYLDDQTYDPFYFTGKTYSNLPSFHLGSVIDEITYREYKTYLNDEIKNLKIQQKYDQLYDKLSLSLTYDEFLHIMEVEIEKYEKSLNRLDFSAQLSETVRDQAMKIAEVIYDHLDNLGVSTRRCPSFNECLNNEHLELCDAWHFRGDFSLL